jgi:hypothetical protein
MWRLRVRRMLVAAGISCNYVEEQVRRMLVAAGLSCDYVDVAGAADAGGGGALI